MLDTIYENIPVGRNEAAKIYNGPFSTTTEWHSFAVGKGCGIATGLTLNPAPVAFAVGFATRQPSKVSEETPVGHLRDLAREPAYALGGITLGLLFGLAIRFRVWRLTPFV